MSVAKKSFGTTKNGEEVTPVSYTHLSLVVLFWR